MLFKLSVRNAKRTFSDYIIYILTVSLAIAMVFALIGAIYIKEIQMLFNLIGSFKGLIFMSVILMMSVVAFMIKYMVKYIIDRRSKEFGLYMLMGIENSDIKKIFWIEQILLGVISFIIGVVLGVLLGEVLKIILFNFFEIKYHFQFENILKVISIVFIITISAYFLAYILSFKVFRQNRIIDWIKQDRINERTVKKKIKKYKVILILSLISIIAVMIFLSIEIKRSPNALTTGVSIIIILLSTFGIASSLFVIFNEFLLRGNKKYKERLILIRFIGDKVVTMSKQLGILAMLFVISLGLITVGMLFANYYGIMEGEYNKIDLSYTYENGEINYMESINKLAEKHGIKSTEVANLYFGESDIYKSKESNTMNFEEGYYIIPLSEYNNIRKNSGYDKKELKEDEFLIQYHLELSTRDVKIPKKNYSLLGKNMKLKDMVFDPMNTYNVADRLYYLVVNDNLLKDKEIVKSNYLWQLEDYNEEELKADVIKMASENNIKIDEWNDLPEGISIPKLDLNEMKVSFITMALSLTMIGLLFSIVMGTLISMNLLSESKSNRARYILMNKIGMSEESLKKLLKRQILVLFLIPLVLGIPIAIITVGILSFVFSVVMTYSYMLVNFLLTAAVFISIYLIYIIVTYRTYKSIVLN